jgi:hypothetical protein
MDMFMLVAPYILTVPEARVIEVILPYIIVPAE